MSDPIISQTEPDMDADRSEDSQTVATLHFHVRPRLVSDDHATRPHALQHLVIDFRTADTWIVAAELALEDAKAAKARVLDRIAEALYAQGLSPKIIHALVNSGLYDDDSHFTF